MSSITPDPAQQGETPTTARLVPRELLIPFILVTALFFLWGIPNNLNDILIRQFMKAFELGRMRAGLVQSAFYLGYFLLAIPSAQYLRRYGYKAGFVTGLVLFGCGTFLFWPAALISRYWCFLLALFVMAGGLAFLETASNLFIALLGRPETSERRLNLAQAFNPLGSITGSCVGTVFIFSGIELSPARAIELRAAGRYDLYLHLETLRVVRPYVALGLVALLWAVLIAITHFPPHDNRHEPAAGPRALTGLLRRRNLMLSVMAQFFYVGAQVGTWSYFIPYVETYTGHSDKFAGYLLTGTLGMFAVGRFTSAYLMRFVAPARLMSGFCVVNIALVAVAILHPGWTGVWAIFVTSAFMSLMYPTIFALGVRGLGAESKLGGSLIVMAIIGGAVLTPLMGLIGDRSHALAWAYAVPLLSYCVIAAYSLTSPSRVKAECLRAGSGTATPSMVGSEL
ncbi:MAG TPA: L-fucose:H+ symporter permease [Acidobacteriaceae bacterium]|nr:L-fucose:H+ symporter permease [Acidobacteriaceae bacterium]